MLQVAALHTCGTAGEDHGDSALRAAAHQFGPHSDLLKYGLRSLVPEVLLPFAALLWHLARGSRPSSLVMMPLLVRLPARMRFFSVEQSLSDIQLPGTCKASYTRWLAVPLMISKVHATVVSAQ